MKKIPVSKNDDDEVVTKGYLRKELKKFEARFQEFAEIVLSEIRAMRAEMKTFSREREQLYSNDVRQELAIDGLGHRVSKLETRK